MKNTRRTFIKLAGVATAGYAVIPSCSSPTSEKTATTAETPEVKEADPEIGIQLYTVRDQLANDLNGTLKAVADTGYAYVELFGYGNEQYFGMGASDFYKLLGGFNLKPVSSHHVSGRAGDNPQGTLLNGWDKAVEDAVSAGQSHMVCSWLFPEERTSLDSYKELTDILNTAGETCKNAGIQLCYHNHDFEFMELEGEIPMYHLLDNTDADLLHMELDLYWITKAGFDTIEFFDKYAGRVPLWHVKDMKDSPEQEFAEVGTGVIDFKKIFANDEKAGMKLFFVEQDVSENPLESIKTSYGNLVGSIL